MHGGVGQLVHHRVPGQRGVVRFHVQLEIVSQSVAAQKGDDVGAIEIVLVRGRLLRFWLDQELAGEADLLFVIDGEVEEAGQVLQLALHVRVVKIHVAFAAPPEDVVHAAQLVRRLDGSLHLGRGIGEHVGIAARGSAVDKAAIAEQVRGAPQQLDAGARLLLLQHADDLVEVGVGVAQRGAFGGHVAVVEAIKRHAELFHELEGDADALAGHVHGIGAVFPGPDGAAGAERIAALAAEGVPVADREAQMLTHRLAFDNLVGVVMSKGQRVERLGAFVGNFRHVGKVRHGGTCSGTGRRIAGYLTDSSKARKRSTLISVWNWVVAGVLSAIRRLKAALGPKARHVFRFGVLVRRERKGQNQTPKQTGRLPKSWSGGNVG